MQKCKWLATRSIESLGGGGGKMSMNKLNKTSKKISQLKLYMLFT
jgi:hypothetical protein